MALPLGFTPNPPPRSKPAAVPVGPAVVNHFHAPAVPKVGASTVLAIVFGVLLLLLAGHDLVAHHWHEPPPTPTPTPTPTPVTGQVWVSFIYDLNAPGQDFGQLDKDPALKTGLESLGVKKRRFAKGDIEARDLGIDALATSLPWMVVNAVGTDKVVSMPCPKTADEVLAVVKKFKGGK